MKVNSNTVTKITIELSGTEAQRLESLLTMIGKTVAFSDWKRLRNIPTYHGIGDNGDSFTGLLREALR